MMNHSQSENEIIAVAPDPLLRHEVGEDGTQESTTAGRIWPWTRLLMWFISLYQRAAAGRPSPCRFTPSCSTYASEALALHGTLRGGTLAIWRILRCNPWGGQGYDPVPGSRSPNSRVHRHSTCTSHSHEHLKAD